MPTLLTPVYNDWISLALLLRELDALAPTLPPLHLLIVDDGSLAPAPANTWAGLTHLASVEVLRLRCNLGHQRAIAIGLSHCANTRKTLPVIVMDGDGEDSPSDLARLLAAHAAQPGAAVVATRAKRSEGAFFRLGYLAYKLVFRCLTGKVINFGNFCLLPGPIAERLAYMPDTWNHLAASLVKSNAPLAELPSRRGRRYAGHSSMGMVSLVVHGFSAISVFSERVLTRLLLCLGLVMVAAIVAALVTVGMRLFTDLALPGWATTVVGFSSLLIFQALSLLAVVVFMTLNNRSALSFVPALQSAAFVSETTLVHPARPAGETVSPMETALPYEDGVSVK